MFWCFLVMVNEEDSRESVRGVDRYRFLKTVSLRLQF